MYGLIQLYASVENVCNNVLESDFSLQRIVCYLLFQLLVSPLFAFYIFQNYYLMIFYLRPNILIYVFLLFSGFIIKVDGCSMYSVCHFKQEGVVDTFMTVFIHYLCT